MTKFSIIVPVYNVEKYIDACLKSILNQNYENYEVIVVNDGTKDNSQQIIDKYVEKDYRFKSFKKNNGGLSDARNYGINMSTGDYLLFVDSDDTINNNLLKELDKEIENKKNIELIKFQINQISDVNLEKKSNLFSDISGELAFPILIESDLFVTAWSYAYEKQFWLKNKFFYEKGKIHEDFGLTPYIVLKAKHVSSINYIGYNYFVRDNSIMTNRNDEKTKKMTNDTLYHFDNLLKKIKKDVNVSYNTKKIFKSYISNTLISRSVILNKNDLKNYSKELKKRKIYIYLMDDSFMRKIKKMLFKISPYLYMKYLVK